MADSTWITQLRKGCAEYILLLALKHGDAYGYELRQNLAQIGMLAMGESTLYPLLSRLTRDGYLSTRMVNSTSGPPRRYYRLTASGRARLKQMNVYWSELVDSIRGVQEGEYGNE